MDQRSETMNYKQQVFRILIAVATVVPIAIYVWKFGWHLSADHARWGEFGSAMSGIYTPILTLLTLSVLVNQVRLQHKMHANDRSLAYVEQARTDLEFYVTRLESMMTLKISTGNTIREVLHHQYQPKTLAELEQPNIEQISEQLNREAPQILGVMNAVQARLAGLSASKETWFSLNYTSAIEKLIAVLSFETCVALENYHRAVTKGRMNSKYAFSPILA
jgi:hypothetical protein